ncbi:MAG: NADH-quinone oxidoreductase subunit D, partial [Dehalococcoidia bacterium]
MVNIGPQHPSTHGVFRMRVTFDGEVVTELEPIFGYLHRGSEKLGEERTYTQVITLTDRLDYVASMSNNLAYVLAAEKLASVEVPERAQYIRVIMAELMRIASHLMGLGFFINDLGALATPLMYMFREREKILDLFELVCGARITFSYMRIGGVSGDLPEEFMPALQKFTGEMPGYIDEYEALLRENEILVARTKGVGILPPEKAINASVTGPMLRASGVPWDLRKADPYEVYDRFRFDIPLGQTGDTYDRFLVRLEEMRESTRIVKQAMEQIPPGPFRAEAPA